MARVVPTVLMYRRCGGLSTGKFQTIQNHIFKQYLGSYLNVVTMSIHENPRLGSKIPPSPPPHPKPPKQSPAEPEHHFIDPRLDITKLEVFRVDIPCAIPISAN